MADDIGENNPKKESEPAAQMQQQPQTVPTPQQAQKTQQPQTAPAPAPQSQQQPIQPQQTTPAPTPAPNQSPVQEQKPAPALEKAPEMPGIEGEKPEPPKDNKDTMWLVINWVGFLFTGLLAPLIVLIFSKSEKAKKHAKIALIIGGVLILLGIGVFVLQFGAVLALLG